MPIPLKNHRQKLKSKAPSRNEILSQFCLDGTNTNAHAHDTAAASVTDLQLPGNSGDLALQSASISDMDGNNLSDAHIQQLLEDAERRLKSDPKSSMGSSDTKKWPSILGLPTSISTGADGGLPSSYIKPTPQGAQIDAGFLVTAKERNLSSSARHVEDPVLVRSKSSKAKKATAGPNWYDLPRTNMTPELKRDLQLLRMRSVLDPKLHFKKEGGKNQVPEFSQVGTIIEGPTEFFSARLTKKERKRTFVEEVLAGETATHRFKLKYNDIQRAKTSGKKAHYKALKAQRRRKSSKG